MAGTIDVAEAGAGGPDDLRHVQSAVRIERDVVRRVKVTGSRRIGSAAPTSDELAAAIPGVRLVTVNPPRGVRDEYELSVLRGASIPLRSSSMRGVLLGPGFGSDPRWVAEALRITLSGLRIVGEGDPPDSADIELLAAAGGCWVGAKTRNRIR